MKRLYVLMLTVLGATSLIALASPTPLYAVDLFKGCTGENSGDSTCLQARQEQNTNQGARKIVSNILKVLMFIIGALSVIMLVYAGFKYTASSGDTQAVQGAKNIILYAIIGIIVALLGYTIVDFVIKNIR